MFTERFGSGSCETKSLNQYILVGDEDEWGFQGQEQHTILLSLVRSKDDGIIGFLKDYRRMNVALTRAKEQLYVIGDSATLGNDAFFIAFLKYVEEFGVYRTVWEWEL